MLGSRELISFKGEHTHPHDNAAITIKKAVESAKTSSKENPFQPLKRVYRDAFAEVDVTDEVILDELPSLSNYQAAMYRSRAKRLPKLPHRRADLEITGEWAQTEDGRDFLLCNDGIEDKILIFATAQNLRHLCEAETIFMDGTFKISPEMFLQVYSLHVMVMDTMMPVCICLLPSKEIAIYTRMFNLIQGACQRYGLQFQPRCFFIDFEIAVITTLTQLFPYSQLRGCLFHFAQSIWRHVQSLGLVVRYTVTM